MSLKSIDDCDDVQLRWMSRALRAENKLRLAGLPGGEAVTMWDKDEYLVITLEHMDGSAPTTTEIHDARGRLLRAQEEARESNGQLLRQIDAYYKQ